jgi:hypothetical protein
MLTRTHRAHNTEGGGDSLSCCTARAERAPLVQAHSCSTRFTCAFVFLFFVVAGSCGQVKVKWEVGVRRVRWAQGCE